MRRVVAGAVLVLALAACGSKDLTPAQKLQDGTATVVDAANSQDLEGLRSAVADLRGVISSQRSAGTLNATKARQLLRLLAAIERDAPLLTGPSPTPSETESPTPSPTPSETESPTPSPTPSPTMSPTPTSSPTPTTVPTALPSPTVGLGQPSEPPSSSDPTPSADPSTAPPG